MNDEFYMRLAIDEAWKYQLLTYPNPAVGAVVLHRGEIVAIEAHQKAGTSHAEVLALVRAYERISGDEVSFDPVDAVAAHEFLRSLPEGFFSECSIYVTLEPCSHEGKTPSCASLLRDLALQKIVIGTKDPIDKHSGGMEIVGRGIPAPTVKLGVLEKECKDLIEPFVIWQERAFVLFKIAQTQNGRIGGGIISSIESRTHVHQLRSACERLIIGGNTVRTDRPILDSRLSGGRAPNVTIYSRDMAPDLSMPLFSIPKRKVQIANRIPWDICKGFILVEGGEGMLKAMGKHIDWMLTYTAPKLSSDPLSYNVDHILEPLHAARYAVDEVQWSRYSGD